MQKFNSLLFIGILLSIVGFSKSEFIIYKILVTPPKILWGDKVHIFYSIIGILMSIMEILLAIGVFKR